MRTKNLLILAAIGTIATQVLVAADSDSGPISYYSSAYNGRTTACQEKFDNSKMTAASKTLPCGTQVKVTNPANDKSVVVKVNDRGPFVKGRNLSVTKAAARELGFVKQGVADAKWEVVK